MTGGEFGEKSIGFWSSVMLLINNVAGPTVSLMPGLVQEAGWLAMILTMISLASISILCGFALIQAILRIPGNHDLAHRVEFTDLLTFYFPRPFNTMALVVYLFYMALTLISYIIQSSQVIDYLVLDIHGCAPGFSFSGPFGPVCGTDRKSSTPFGADAVLSYSMLAIAVICVPLSVLNLDDNIVLQWIAIAGLTIMATVWIQFLLAQPDFPEYIPAATATQGNLLGTLLFNFAFMSTLPSWLNEKRPDVHVGWSCTIALGYVVVVYSAIGILGGMAFPAFYDTDQNLFSKLNGSGWWPAQLTVAAYPILQNFTSIPVLAILIRYNLQHIGISSRISTLLAFGVPWILSVAFYTGHGFNTVATIGGYFTSSIINFIVPVVVFLLARTNSTGMNNVNDMGKLSHHFVRIAFEVVVVLSMLLIQLGDDWQSWPTVVFSRVLRSLTTPPTRIDAWAGILILISIPSLFCFGLCSGRLRTLSPHQNRWRGLVQTFFCPAFFEELWFRGVLLPPDAGKSDFAQVPLNLLAFAVHRINFFKQDIGSPDWLSLSEALLLGVGCVVAYLGSGGSLWLAILSHWIPVWIWLFFFGGFEQRFKMDSEYEGIEDYALS